MPKLTWLSVVLLACAASSARAADPALVARFDKLLVADQDHYDERAVLAAVLARPADSAAFDADARAAENDPALSALMLVKWRGVLAAFAGAESRRPDIDLNRTYRNWSEMMTPEMRAYTAQRMLSMSSENRDKLIYYLKKLNADLAADGGKIDQGFFSIDKRIVAGVMDQYRKDLAAYAATPLAAQGRRDGAHAAAELSGDLAARAASAAPEVPPAPKASAPKAPAPKTAAPRPVPPPLPPTPVPQHGAPPAAGPGADGALAQAQEVAGAGAAGGAAMDGARGGGAPQTGPGPSAPAPDVSGPPSGLSASAPGPVKSAATPPAPGAEDAFMNSVENSGTARNPALGKASWAGAALGAVLGGLVGFLVGGPVGAAVGAAVGGGAGFFGMKALIAKLF
ncbi:MAG: hypothetical protein HKL90_10410 [Elusimicrobia bacterium]|nr:hypothetical protein [Elusimicrobiota bacterium]